MKFKLSKRNFSSAYSENESIIEKIKQFLNDNKKTIAMGGVMASLVATFVSPKAAHAIENKVVDTTIPTAAVQTYDNQTETLSDEEKELNAMIDDAQERIASESQVQEETSQEASVENQVQEETSQEASVENQAQEETSQEALVENQAQEETSQEASVENQAQEETSQETSVENQAQEETSQEASVENQVQEETSQEASVENQVQEETKTTVNVRHFNGYDVIENGEHLIAVGNVPSTADLAEQLNQFYDLNSVDVTAYNLNYILTSGQNQIADTGYTVDYQDGNIIIMDADGNVVYKQIYEKTTETTNSNENIADEKQTSQDVVNNKITVEDNQYVLMKSQDGTYYVLGLGGVGLSNSQIQDLIAVLQKEGKLPADANVVSGVLPDAPTDEMKDLGDDERKTTIGDYTFVTTDGTNYVIRDKDGNDLAVYDAITGEMKQLEENKKTSEDSNAEPDLKPSHDEPNPDPDPKPTPDPEPTPDTPEKGGEGSGPEKALPQTGDPSSVLPGVLGLGGAAMTAAGLAGTKRKKDKQLQEDNESDIEDNVNKKMTRINKSINNEKMSIDEQVDAIMREINKSVYGDDTKVTRGKVR